MCGDDFIPRLEGAFPLGVEFLQVVVVPLPEPEPEGGERLRREVEVHGPVEGGDRKFVPQIVDEGAEPDQLGHVVFHGLFVGREIGRIVAPRMTLDGEFVPVFGVVGEEVRRLLLPVPVVELGILEAGDG